MPDGSSNSDRTEPPDNPTFGPSYVSQYRALDARCSAIGLSPGLRACVRETHGMSAELGPKCRWVVAEMASHLLWPTILLSVVVLPGRVSIHRMTPSVNSVAATVHSCYHATGRSITHLIHSQSYCSRLAGRRAPRRWLPLTLEQSARSTRRRNTLGFRTH